MAKMFWLIVAIFSLSSVAQAARVRMGFDVLVNNFIRDHQYLENIDPNAIINSLPLDATIVGDEFEYYYTDPRFIDSAKNTALGGLRTLAENYQEVIDEVNEMRQIQLASSTIYNSLLIPIESCKDVINSYLDNVDGVMTEDFIEIRDKLLDIDVPAVTDRDSLKQYLELYVVITAVYDSIRERFFLI